MKTPIQFNPAWPKNAEGFYECRTRNATAWEKCEREQEVQP